MIIFNMYNMPLPKFMHFFRFLQKCKTFWSVGHVVPVLLQGHCSIIILKLLINDPKSWFYQILQSLWLGITQFINAISCSIDSALFFFIYHCIKQSRKNPLHGIIMDKVWSHCWVKSTLIWRKCVALFSYILYCVPIHIIHLNLHIWLVKYQSCICLLCQTMGL